jgi:NADH-quinone oxidoreductase subunit H
MDLGWKLLIPLALGWLLLIAAMRLAGPEGWNVGVVAIVGALIIVAAAGLLSLAMRVGTRRREVEEALR